MINICEEDWIFVNSIHVFIADKVFLPMMYTKNVFLKVPDPSLPEKN